MPPNGSRGSDATRALTDTRPDSIRRATPSARSMSWLQTVAPRPYRVSLASSIASSSLENGVIVYSNATIYGGETVIGAHSVIGASASITKSVPPNTVVTVEKPTLRFRAAS